MGSRPKAARSPGSHLGPAEVLRHRNNAVRHLTVLSRDLEARLRRGLAAQDFGSLRASLGPLFFLVWTRPTPITSLAEQLGVTKQACSQLANLAERAGYLERIQSREDGRSKPLHLARRGRQLVAEAIEIIRQADSDYASIVGPRPYARFTKTIAALYKALDFPAESGLAFLEKATRSIGTLPLITQRAEQALMQATAAHGHAGLKLSHSQILPFVGRAGIRITDLTRIHGARRQAIGATARDLVALGYLRKEADPLDRRGAVLFLTDRGERLVSDSLVELASLQRRIDRTLGRAVVSEFLETAAKLDAALHTDEDTRDLSAGRNSEIQDLAKQLHRELGDRQSRQLAELLQQRAAAPARHDQRPKQGSPA